MPGRASAAEVERDLRESRGAGDRAADADPLDVGVGADCAGGRAADERHERMVGCDREGVSRERDPRGGVEGGIRRAAGIEDGLNLGEDALAYLAGQRAPLDREQAAIWQGGHLGAARDARGTEQPRAEQGMGPSGQPFRVALPGLDLTL